MGLSEPFDDFDVGSANFPSVLGYELGVDSLTVFLDEIMNPSLKIRSSFKASLEVTLPMSCLLLFA